MGEVDVPAVDPRYQRHGVGRALLEHSFARSRHAGMAMVMVETGDDGGHAPARLAYEAMGFECWPVARYFKDLGRWGCSTPGLWGPSGRRPSRGIPTTFGQVTSFRKCSLDPSGR